MPTSRKATKFLQCIPTSIRKTIELEESQFILEALKTRKKLLETISVLLDDPSKVSVKDLAAALKVIQEQLHSSIKEYSLLQEDKTEEEELIEIPETDLTNVELPTI